MEQGNYSPIEVEKNIKKEASTSKMFEDKMISLEINDFEDFYNLSFEKKEKIMSNFGIDRIGYEKDNAQAFNKEWEDISQIYGFSREKHLNNYPNVLSVENIEILKDNKDIDIEARYKNNSSIGEQLQKIKELKINEYSDYFSLNLKEKEDFLVKMGWYPKKDILNRAQKFFGDKQYSVETLDKQYSQSMLIFMRKSSEKIPNEYIAEKDIDEIGSVYEKGVWVINNTNYFKNTGYVHVDPSAVSEGNIERYNFYRNTSENLCSSLISMSIDPEKLSIDQKIDFFNKLSKNNCCLADLSEFIDREEVGLIFDTIQRLDQKNDRFSKSFREKIKKELLLPEKERTGKFKKISQFSFKEICEDIKDYDSYIQQRDIIVEQFSDHICEKIKNNREIIDLLKDSGITLDFMEDVSESVVGGLKNLNNAQKSIIDKYLKSSEAENDRNDYGITIDQFGAAVSLGIHLKNQEELNNLIHDRVLEKLDDEDFV